MRRTFWPNCIFQRFRSKSRSTWLKFTPIRENSRLSMKIVRNVLFRPCWGRSGENAFSTFRSQQSLYRTEIHANTWKQYAYYENCTKRAFQAMGRPFWPNRISQSFRSINCSTGLKFTPISENSRLSIKLYKTCFLRYAEDVLGKSHFLTF